MSTVGVVLLVAVWILFGAVAGGIVVGGRLERIRELIGGERQ